MAQQLLNRLKVVFDDAPWRHVKSIGRLPAGVGRTLVDVRTMVVHETSGWPARKNGSEMFFRAFLAGPGHPHTGETTQLYVAGDGTVLLGMELPQRTQHATFVNDWSLAAETGHGWGNYRSNQHLGPFTTTDETMIPNPNPTHKPPFIKGPTNGNLIPLRAKPGNRWIPLGGDGTIDDVADDDLPGIKLFVRHASFSEVVVGWWTTGRYTGPWRQPQRVPEMLFTEAQYRSWALLARYVAEEFLLPRNFPLLPHKTRAASSGTSGSHGMIRDAASFSAIVLADEALSRSPRTFGLPASQAPPTAAALQAAYQAAATAERNPLWKSLFNTYRGFHGHGFSGDPTKLKDHDCPGPMFDWYRLAREVWDWCWWPFDVDTANPATAVPARPYSLSSRDGDTPLREYFWTTPATVPQGRVRTGIHGAAGSPKTFELPATSRIYAISNGDLVAARFPAETDQVSLAFVLVRHEVFHQLDTRPPKAGTPKTRPVFADRIDYDVPPAIVYSLYMHLGRPAGMSFDQVVTPNPDWLNRLLTRQKECELGVAFHASPTGAAIPAAKWNDPLPGAVTRPSLLAGWKADDKALTTFLAALRAGTVAAASLDADTTPIRVVLGDFIANAGVIRRTGALTQRGVRVEMFSNTLVSNTDFMLSDTRSTSGGWAPLVGTSPPAVRYASEWARTPAGAELTAVQAAGVVDPRLVNWWADAQPATLNPRLPTDAHLDEHGVVVHYDVMSFLPWLNRRTWRSEWPKYQVTDPAGVPAAPQPR